jgi:tetratricopeptide (TPR) repeat protein
MRFERSVFGAVAAVLIFAILTLSGCDLSPDAKEARYLEKGRKEFQKRNYAVAILHFKNASGAKPWDAEPYYQLGLSYFAGNDGRSAAANFRKAVEVNPRHTGAQLQLAQLMATARDKNSLEEAQKHAQAVLALQPDDPDALSVLGVTDLRLGNPESAQSHLEQALRKSPNHLRAWVVLSEVKMARHDVAGAEKALQEASTRLPKSPDPKIYLGQFYVSQSRAPEAEQQFRQALAMDPKNGTALLELGAMQVKAGHTDEAEQTYRQVSALPEKQYRSVHAEFLFRSGKRDQGVAELAKLAAADPADLSVRTNLVEAYLAVNRAGDAEKVLTAAPNKNGLDEDARIRRSRIYLDWGKYTEAEADLNQVLHFRKDSAEAYYLLAKVSQGRANITKQKQQLQEALNIDRTFLAARIELARALLASQNAKPALTLLDEAPENQMNAGPLILQRNWALLALGDKEAARKGIDRVLTAGKVPEALLQDGAMKLDRKDYAGARKSIEEALDKTPEDVRALFMLVRSYTAQKQTAEAVQIMREYAQKQPKSPAVQEYLGRVLATGGDRAGARKAFEAAKAARPGFVDADFDLAQLDFSEGKLDDARKKLSEAAATHPDNKNAHLLLARFEMTTGKTPSAIEQFKKAVALDGKDALAFNSLAYLLAQSKQPDEAVKYAQKAWELAPDNPAVEDTLGWVYYQQGQYPLAVVQLEAANAKQGTAVRKYHLAMAYLKAGKPDRARQTLDAALKMDSKLPEAQAARQAFGIGPN